MTSPKSFKILYIEDDPINAFVLQRMLTHHDVDVAATGTEGMAMSELNHYDLVLMDINLGSDEHDGVYYMHQLRKGEYKDKPIVAVTGYAMSGDRERLMEEGFDEYFSKPVEKLRLILFIETYRKLADGQKT